MPRIIHFIEDATKPLVMQFGTVREPYNLTGKTVQIRLRDLESDQLITTGDTVVQTPASAGRAQRVFAEAELVVGRVFVVEGVVNTNELTFPDAQFERLEVEMQSRRTTPGAA